MPTWFTDDPTKFMQPPSKSGAHLTILSGSLDVEALEGLVGLHPDEAWEQGTRRHAAGRFAGVSFRSGLHEEAPPSDHLADLLRRLEPVSAQVAEAAADERVRVRLWLVHKIENWNPGISLSSDAIAKVVKLGIGIEIDIYVLNAADIVEHTT